MWCGLIWSCWHRLIPLLWHGRPRRVVRCGAKVWRWWSTVWRRARRRTDAADLRLTAIELHVCQLVPDRISSHVAGWEPAESSAPSAGDRLVDARELQLPAGLRNRRQVLLCSDAVCYTQIGMWRSQPISASVGCGFHVQNPSDSDADLSCDQNYQLLWLL